MTAMIRACCLALVGLSACGIGTLESGEPGRSTFEAIDEANQPRLREQLWFRLSDLPTSGKAAQQPWVGYWWPFYDNGIAHPWTSPDEPSPAAKYDAAFGGQGRAMLWEAANHTASEKWFGHCDGRTVASIVEPEPKWRVRVGETCMTPGDMKALLTEVYTGDLSGQDVETVGGYCWTYDPEVDESGRPTAAPCRDVNPGTFHVVIASLLGKHRQAFYMDEDSKLEIWNRAVSGFTSSIGEPTRVAELSEEERALLAPGTRAVVEVTTTVETIPGGVWTRAATAPETSRLEYVYRLELDASGTIIGGEWLGSSRLTHPDMLKVPHRGAKKVPTYANPNIDYARLLPFIDRAAQLGRDEC